jgi:hypothetical protein
MSTDTRWSRFNLVLSTAIAVALAGFSTPQVADAQTYGGSVRPVQPQRSVSSTQVRQQQTTQRRVITRTTQVNRSQVVNRPIRVSRPVRGQRWVSPPRGAYRVHNRAFPRNARWVSDPRTYTAYSIYNGDVWYLDPTTGWGYTVDRWGVVYTVDPRTSWVYSLGELARWTADLLYFFDYYSYDRGYWRADYYNDYYNYWRSPRATFYSWDAGYDRLWGYNNYFVSQTFVQQTTVFSTTYIREVREEIVYERANPTFVQQQVAAVGVSALQAQPPAQISTAFVPTQATMDYVQVADQGVNVMVPVVDGQSAAIVEPLAVNEAVPADAVVFDVPAPAPVEAAPTVDYSAVPSEPTPAGDVGGYTDVKGEQPVITEPMPVEAQPEVGVATPDAGSMEAPTEDGFGKENSGFGQTTEPEFGNESSTPYTEPLPEAQASEPTFESQPEPAFERQAEPAYEEPRYEQPQAEPAYEEPRYEQQAEPAYEEPQAEPVYEQPQYERQAEPAYEEPRYEQQAEPAYEEPRYEQQAEPAYEEPRYEQRAEPAYEEPRYEQQAEPAYEQPSYQEPEPQYEAPQPEPQYEAPQPEPEPQYEQPQEEKYE